jgi:hemoglobin-like flavoprotein
MDLNVLNESLKRAKQENGGTTALGLAFYKRLFEQYPSVKHLFNTPPEEQHKKLMASLGAIVAGASNTDTLVPYLQAMAIRHLKYGTENAHYAAVQENLLAVLASHLSVEGEWTPAMQTAWTEALTLVSTVMMDAASNPEACSERLKANGYQPDGFREGSDTPWLMVKG